MIARKTVNTGVVTIAPNTVRNPIECIPISHIENNKPISVESRQTRNQGPHKPAYGERKRRKECSCIPISHIENNKPISVESRQTRNQGPHKPAYGERKRRKECSCIPI